jgi:NAD(P)-dependent dehydrogenase (short-subunit alcohol dehydrogenase family)
MSEKIVVITGGSRGLGRSMALQLARRGVHSLITYQSNRAEADKVVELAHKAGVRSVALQLDVGRSSTFEDFARDVQKVLHDTWKRDRFDFLINNAGHGVRKPFAETTEAEFDGLCNVHLKGTYFLTQKLLPLIADGGRILNLSSGLARFSRPGNSAYGAMKGGIEVLTRYLAAELGPRRITVNTIAPGATATDFAGGFIRENKDYRQMVASRTALGRVGEPDDIGGAVAVLLSDETAWINGQRIEIAGGIDL